MLNKYEIINGKKLRYGYTTGSCAAGAAKAAAMMLFGGKPVDSVKIDTPAGWRLELPVSNVTIAEDSVSCGVKKDAGDDPDITDGIIIYAKAVKSPGGDIRICAGEGIGRVTRKGLSVQQGMPAINPVPMKMIQEEVRSILPEDTGVSIEISAPEGVALAEKTFNPKLGIEGGISILGTTGIVKPMSEEAMKESLALRISVLKEAGIQDIVFVPGNYGEKFAAEDLKLRNDRIVITGNYIGYMLEQAVYYGIKKILMVGHIGKLIKVAGGIFNTHSRYADARLEIIASHYANYSGSNDQLKDIMNCRTAEEALDFIQDDSFYNYVCEKIKIRCGEFVSGKLAIEAVIFSLSKGLLGKSKGAENMITSLRYN
jgi:cobalt-precorrin-5B (C1)-methyltransferase